MVHSYKQKTAQTSYREGILTQTLNAIRNGMSLKKASKQFGIVNSVSGDSPIMNVVLLLGSFHTFMNLLPSEL